MNDTARNAPNKATLEATARARAAIAKILTHLANNADRASQP